MKTGGWRAFREESKKKVLAETAAAELERPAAVSHTISLPPAEAPVPVHPTTPATVPDLVPDKEPKAAGKARAAGSGKKQAGQGDPDLLFERAVATMRPEWPVVPSTGTSRLRAAMLPHTIWPPTAPPPLEILRRNWHVAAIVPVAAAASLLAVWAGVNPYALCLQWWDFLYGAIFLSASCVFIGLAIWKRGGDGWHPGAPALAIVIGVVPFWMGTNLIFGSACPDDGRASIASPAAALPPLPAPIEVHTLGAAGAPMPMPRPAELDFDFSPRRLDLETGGGNVQIAPPAL